jgi:hypothetical protein
MVRHSTSPGRSRFRRLWQTEGLDSCGKSVSFATCTLIVGSPMSPTEKELGDALQAVVEQSHALEGAVAKLQAGLFAVKAALALQINPSAPEQALKRIQDMEQSFAERDPSAAARKQVSEVLEMLKIFEKHGGPKQA